VTDPSVIDELFRQGLQDAARPHVRAAIEHRDAMPTPLPVVRARRVRPGRVVAIAAAVAACVGVVAYATPKVMDARHVSVQHPGAHDAPPATISHNGTSNTGSTPAPQQQHPGIVPSPSPQQQHNTPTSVANATGPGGQHPADDTGSDAAPAFTIANHVLVVLDDNGVHASAARAIEGVVEIGFQDARAHRSASEYVRLGVSRVNGSIAPGHAAQLHLNEIGVDYVLASSIDGKVSGQATLAVDVPALANHGDANPVVTINIDARSCVNRDWRTGDEPFAAGDTAPPSTRHWTTMLSTGSQKPTFVVQTHDGRVHHLTLRGVGAYHQGDIAAGVDHQNFQPPSGARVGSKYVLSYDGFADGTHEFAVWVL
jgi:hypothetical protein